MEDEGIIASIEKSKNIVIPKFNGTISPKYMTIAD